MHSIIARSFFVASALSLVGCAANTDKPVDDGNGSVSDSTDALSSLSKSLVGSYEYDHAASTVQFYTTLVLGADLSYSADTKPYCPPGMMCPLYIKHEEGTWKATSSHGGTLHLTTSFGDKKTFAIGVAATELKLSDGTGIEHMTKLAKVGEHCGGNLATARTCESGLVCFGGPLVGDVGGTCMKPVGEGGSCGFRTQNSPCADGLECRHVSGPRDALTCEKPAPTCPTGQHQCAAYTDASGTCHPAYCLFIGAMCMTGAPC
jgi:hypothetical protein